jgi:hypothetical protein
MLLSIKYIFGKKVKNDPMNDIVNGIYLIFYTFKVDALTTELTFLISF